MQKAKPILVTLTAPSAAGKSYLLNYIRDVAKMPCLISTTTRKPRIGEREGIDYYFIDEDTSYHLEKTNQFAELAVYNGIRYGVTKNEFYDKLSKGIAFLIVEPSGIDHYVKPALDAGAVHLKYYIHTDAEVRLKRFKQRVAGDISNAIMSNTASPLITISDIEKQTQKIVSTHLDRLETMLTKELKWSTMVDWDRIIFGEHAPADNLAIILKDINKILDRRQVNYSNDNEVTFIPI